MTKQSPPIPKRDFLPSQRPDHITKGLDAAYEAGFGMGRRAGLERACDILREMKPGDVDVFKLLELFTAEKYR